ncbi:MAG: Crp/Fnr family transcriptional regulator [Steroidobacteraceae bacterium]
MPSTAPSDGSNHILDGLSRRGRDRILKECEHVTLAPNEILLEPGRHIRHVHFPIAGVIALMGAVDDHEGLALGLVGSEGVLGSSLMLGTSLAPLRARVQVTGRALRIQVTALELALADTPHLRRQLLLAHYEGMEQIAQIAACAIYHVVDVRIAYWLLMTHDRIRGDDFFLTHETLARMLGVRRSGVTAAAGLLQDRKLISYSRGYVSILDRGGLEEIACECYRPAGSTMRHALS